MIKTIIVQIRFYLERFKIIHCNVSSKYDGTQNTTTNTLIQNKNKNIVLKDEPFISIDTKQPIVSNSILNIGKFPFFVFCPNDTCLIAILNIIEENINLLNSNSIEVTPIKEELKILRTRLTLRRF